VDHKEFNLLRQALQKTQKQMAELLGTSLKAIQSYDQGWRRVPVHIERQVFFLIAAHRQISGDLQPCWDIRKCPSEIQNSCPAYEFNMGRLCWFINGTVCQGKPWANWAKKMKICRTCEVFGQVVKNHEGAGSYQRRA